MKYNVILCLTGGLCLTAVTQAATNAYRTAVLADSPLVYYEFDETSGTTAANSGSTGAANDGTIGTAGGSVTINQPSFAQGGTSYDFGGGHVLAAALPSSLTEWTIEAWVNWDPAKNSASNIFGNDQGGWNDDVLFGIGAEAGSMGVPASSVGLIQQGSPGTIRDFVESPMAHSEWHHVAVTASTISGELILYVDGMEVDKNEALNNGITMNGGENGDPGTIGTPFISVGGARAVVDAGYRPFDGLIDEFAIYGTVLDAGTIASHHAIGASEAPDVVIITDVSSDAGAGTLRISWESTGGKLYNLRSEADPSQIATAVPIDWPIFDGNSDLAATPPENTLTIPMPADLTRLFVVEGFPAPPVTVFSDDFEGGQGGWTTGTEGAVGTLWELGSPGGGPAAANSPANCFGTNSTSYYAEDANVWLRSPPIDLTNAGGATLQYFEWRDIEATFDSGRVAVLDAADDSEIAQIEDSIDGSTNGWENVSRAIPPAALGKVIKIEFWLQSDNFGNRPGWFVDDFSITTP